MSITRDHGKIVFECDSCGETFETETSEFDLALDMLKHEGWRSRKYGKDWVHICSDECGKED